MGSSKKPQDATRQERKAKKRKLEDAVPDLPGDAEPAEEVVDKKSKKRKRDKDADVEDAVTDEEKERTKKEKKEKKRRKKEAEEEVGAPTDVEEGKVEKKEKKSKKENKDTLPGKVDSEILPEAEAGEQAGPKKSKKERKAERRAAEAVAKGKDAVAPVEESGSTSKGEANCDAKTKDVEGEKKSKKNNRNREKKRKGGSVAVTSEGEGGVDNGDRGKGESKENKDARFICFIGNLPFTATHASISKHFAPVKPISVRALTQKDDPSKSKGIAFIEFDGYDHMKTCLKMFHHSMFDDGLSAPRKINVELTAGGGGNTKDRRAKIQEKNQKLNEQRARRMQEEAKAKLEKSNNAVAIDESAIHPSRRTRVPGV